MINVHNTLTGNDSFTMIDDIVFRMYPLLDGFTIETAGLYAYLKSWRQNDLDHKFYNCVWLAREEIYAQTGIGRKPFDRHLKALKDCGLVTVERGRLREANKQLFVVNNPITEAEFRARYPEAVAKFNDALQDYYGRRDADRAQLAEKMKEKQEVAEAVQPEKEHDEVIRWLTGA